MQTLSQALDERLSSLRLQDTELLNAAIWIRQGDAIAELLLAISRLFHRAPDLRPVTHH